MPILGCTDPASLLNLSAYIEVPFDGTKKPLNVVVPVGRTADGVFVQADATPAIGILPICVPDAEYSTITTSQSPDVVFPVTSKLTESGLPLSAPSSAKAGN